VKKKISLLIPTRKRFDKLKKIVEQLANVDLEIVVGIDLDDDTYDIDYLESNNVVVVRTPCTKYLGNIYNILFEYSSGEIIGIMADDIEFTNLNKFQEVSNWYSESNKKFLWYFSPCNRPYPHCVPDHCFITRDAIMAIGMLFPIGFEHGYLDHYLGRLYKEIDCAIQDPSSFIKHNRVKDETLIRKSYELDENNTTCDQRDVILFDKICKVYLPIHKQIIMDINKGN
jgi:glycosyltransferase involved in cell wall biosynthesis